MRSQYGVIAQEFCRALRGARSQRALSLRLGHRTNVAYAWESGRRSPTLTPLLRIAQYNGVDVHRRLASFLRHDHAFRPELEVTEPALVAALFAELKGSASNAALGERLGRSGSQVSRWTTGASKPRLSEVFAFVELTTSRLLDFVALFVDPSTLPSVARPWTELEERRRVAVELPWSHAVLRVLELASYAELPAHDDAWVAQRLGLAVDEVRRCLAALRRAGVVRRRAGRYRTTAKTVDMTRGPAAPRRQLKAHWLREAVERQPADDTGLYSYNLVSVSRQDLERLRALHVDYFHAIRRVVADSDDPDCVALVAMQLFELDAASPPPGQ